MITDSHKDTDCNLDFFSIINPKSVIEVDDEIYDPLEDIWNAFDLSSIESQDLFHNDINEVLNGNTLNLYLKQENGEKFRFIYVSLKGIIGFIFNLNADELQGEYKTLAIRMKRELLSMHVTHAERKYEGIGVQIEDFKNLPHEENPALERGNREHVKEIPPSDELDESTEILVNFMKKCLNKDIEIIVNEKRYYTVPDIGASFGLSVDESYDLFYDNLELLDQYKLILYSNPKENEDEYAVFLSSGGVIAYILMLDIENLNGEYETRAIQLIKAITSIGAIRAEAEYGGVEGLFRELFKKEGGPA